ncbi:MAG: response regulator [Clostridia bacterium]|nr:response regulator [Clostridia bacterium]
MVLIVDDNVEEKIGMFKDELQKKNFEVVVTPNLEEAQDVFNKRNNDIDTIILDYYFPETKMKEGDEKDNQFYGDDKTPNGIVFLRDNAFKIKTKLIPIIINTASDDSVRDYWLKKMDTSDFTILECTERGLLSEIANAGGTKLNECLEFIEEGRRKREIMKNNAPTENRRRSSGPFRRDSAGNIIGYRD